MDGSIIMLNKEVEQNYQNIEIDNKANNSNLIPSLMEIKIKIHSLSENSDA